MRNYFFRGKGLVVLLLLMAGGCNPQKKLVRGYKNLEETYKYHLGVSVFDFDAQKTLVSWQDNRHFNPASNTKIYTLFACLNALGDSLPGIQYLISGDTLRFKGTGDPAFLHPELPVSKVFDFLKTSPYHLVYHESTSPDGRFGPGWAWDDYNDYYQAEKSPFPLYGNLVRFTGDSVSVLRTEPPYFNTALRSDGTKPGIVRDEFANVFRFSGRPLPVQLRQDIPFITSPLLTAKLLNAVLGREVALDTTEIGGPLVTLGSIPVDTVYRKMMQESDNMIAEQLWYSYASKYALPLKTSGAIQHALEHHFAGMPDSLVWRDGSGLSRYNLFTPRTTVEVLNRMIRNFPQQRVLSLFPEGGKSGTLKYLYKDTPVKVFAKSGSFSNNYCLSGYLFSRKGKLLIFSVMNNNFAYPIRDFQRVTEKIVKEIYEKY